MGHALSSDEVEQFERDGFLSPIAVFHADEVATLRSAFESFERSVGPEQAMAKRTNLHVLHRWAWDVITDPRVVDPVTSLLGRNVLLWTLNWFIKEPGNGKFVSLHQDANYWGLEPHDVVTAWIALSDASPQTGPMRFLPGTHRGDLFLHDNTYADDNLLSRGQTVKADLDESAAVLAPLAAGEMSLHHVRLIHGSGPNLSRDRRIGMVARYCATHVRQTKAPDAAALVAGEDHYGNFELLPAPAEKAGVEEERRHAEAVKRTSTIILSD